MPSATAPTSPSSWPDSASPHAEVRNGGCGRVTSRHSPGVEPHMTDPRSSSSLLPRLEAAADRNRSITFVTGATDSAAYTTEAVEWARVHDDARAMAAELQARGVQPGHTIGLIGPTTRDLVTAIQAIWLTGAARRHAAAADAHGLDRGVRRPDPGADGERRVPGRDRRRPAPRVPTPGAERPADGHARRAAGRGHDPRPRRVPAPRRRPELAGDPAVHEWEHRRAEGRDAPAPLRHRRTSTRSTRRSSSTTTWTAPRRGFRSTTTWV